MNVSELKSMKINELTQMAKKLKIEGYADHMLKDPKDPLAAENRRIEILLRKDRS